MGGKTSEDHRMNRPNPSTGQHGNDGFWHHRHIDDDPVAFLNSLPHQHSGKTRHLIQQLTIAEGFDRPSYGAIVDESRLISSALFDMPIEGVVARVHRAAVEPAIKRRAGSIENPVPFFVPMNPVRYFGPEALRCVSPPSINFFICTRDHRNVLPFYLG